jgi:thermitase
MRVLKGLGLAALIVLSGHGTLRVGAQSSSREPAFVPGEVIVKYRPNASPSARGRARAAAAVSAVAALAERAAERGHGRTELVRLAPGASLQAARAILLRDPAVEYVEPNWIYTHHAAPNDPYFAQQWALENSGQPVAGIRGNADADVDALDGWARASAPNEKIYVGVIDMGIDWSHPDLGAGPAGAIWTNPFDPIDGADNDGNGYTDDIHGWDFTDQTNTVYDGTPADSGTDAHGTHVAGTIAARRDNGIGIAGVSRDVVIIPAKFLGAAGGTTAAAVQALDYLTDLKIRHGLNIIATNNSWGGGGYSQSLLEAIARAAREDILFITSAGNGGPDDIGDDNDALWSYPGNYDTSAAAGYDAVISVTATDQFDELAPYANFGATNVDLAAPGSIVISTTPQNTYSFSSGTSMAAPHVTGAAVIAHGLTGKTGPDLRDAILAAIDPLPALAGRTATGGRLNLGRLTPPLVPPSPGTNEIVLYAADAAPVAGNWSVKPDETAAGGTRLQSTNLGAAKVAPALAAPASYFELTFNADAGKGYHLWVRAKAEGNAWANDSVHVQFDDLPDRQHRQRSSEPRGLQRLRRVGMGLAGQRLRRRRPGTADLLRDRGTAAHPDPDPRGWCRHRPDRAVELQVRIVGSGRAEERRDNPGRLGVRRWNRRECRDRAPSIGAGVDRRRLEPRRRRDRSGRRTPPESQRRRTEDHGGAREPGRLLRDDLRGRRGAPLPALDSRQGRRKQLGQRLGARAVQRHRHGDRSPDPPHRHDVLSRGEPGGLLELRHRRLGLAGRRLRCGRAGTGDQVRDDWGAHHPRPGARGRSRDRSDRAVGGPLPVGGAGGVEE